MESKKPQYRSVQTKLGVILKETWKIYSKNFLAFCGLFVLPVLLGIGLKMGVLAFLGVNALTNKDFLQNLNIGLMIGGLIVVAIVGWLIQLLGLNATLRGAYYSDTQEKLPFGQAFTEGLQKLGKSAGLSVRVFLYTGVWIIAVIGLVFGLGMLATLFVATESNSSFVNMMQPIMSFMGFMPLVMLVALIFLIQRICRATFAFPILLSKDVSSKEALAESIRLADGITGVIFSNFFLYGLLLAVVSAVFGQLFMQVVMMVYKAPASGTGLNALNYLQNVTEIAGVIPGIVMGSFSVVFQYAFMKKAREEKSEQSGMPQAEASEAAQVQPTAPAQPTPPVQPTAPKQPDSPNPPQEGSTFKL